mmetsp:Transcript_15266/g.25700  ORF Transcript_15266/g.25700 Transcript_15266/m.25700 type:complete len:88 (-) Transcript_15266:278-541(-)
MIPPSWARDFWGALKLGQGGCWLEQQPILPTLGGMRQHHRHPSNALGCMPLPWPVLLECLTFGGLSELLPLQQLLLHLFVFWAQHEA